MVGINYRNQIEVKTGTMGYISSRRVWAVVRKSGETVGMGKEESNFAMFMMARRRNSRKVMTFGE
jgi:hypothetical protein